MFIYGFFMPKTNIEQYYFFIMENEKLSPKATANASFDVKCITNFIQQLNAHEEMLDI